MYVHAITEGTDIVKDVNCYQRCHFSGNAITAPAAELPPRSILCLTCHSGSPVVKDYLSRAGIGAFGVGMLLVTSAWVQGLMSKQQGLSIPACLWRIWQVLLDLITAGCISTLVEALNRVLHGKLFRVSRCRMSTCVCMLVGILGRLMLGIFTWLVTWLAPVAPLTQILVNKNTPGIALITDGLGLLVLIGVTSSVLQRTVGRNRQAVAQEQDTFGTVLVGFIFLIGFVVEGARILVTELEPGVAIFSFVGYSLSLALRLIPANWDVFYGWLWYVHAGSVAALIAYVPFSKFIRVLLRPIAATFGSAVETEV